MSALFKCATLVNLSKPLVSLSKPSVNLSKPLVNLSKPLVNLNYINKRIYPLKPACLLYSRRNSII